MRLLLAVDSSRGSLKAVDFLIEHVRRYKETPAFELVNVQAPLPKLPRISVAVSKTDIRRYYKEEGAERLAAAKKKLDAAGLEYRARILVGPVAERSRAARRRRASTSARWPAPSI